MGKISYIERRKWIFSIKMLKIEKRKRIFLQNLIYREEKEKFFLTILKFEKRKRIWFSNSWKSRREREMKIQFSRPREKKMSHFSRHFSRDRDSCHRLVHPTKYYQKLKHELFQKNIHKVIFYPSVDNFTQALLVTNITSLYWISYSLIIWRILYLFSRALKSLNFPVGRLWRAKTFRTKCVNLFHHMYV